MGRNRNWKTRSDSNLCVGFKKIGVFPASQVSWSLSGSAALQVLSSPTFWDAPVTVCSTPPLSIIRRLETTLFLKKKRQKTHSPENFCGFCFFEFTWEFCIEKWRVFLAIFFSGVRFPQNEARKVLKKFGENLEQHSGENSGRKFEQFGELSFCNFSDLICKRQKTILGATLGFPGHPQSSSRNCTHDLNQFLEPFSERLAGKVGSQNREVHSMDRCRCRPELSDRFGSCCPWEVQGSFHE